MGILKAMKASWQGATTAEKINLVLDIILGFGAAAISESAVKKLMPNMNRVERICARITTGGLSMAIGEAASKAYRPYTDNIGKILDTAKARAAAAEKKEEEANG